MKHRHDCLHFVWIKEVSDRKQKLPEMQEERNRAKSMMHLETNTHQYWLQKTQIKETLRTQRILIINKV